MVVSHEQDTEPRTLLAPEEGPQPQGRTGPLSSLLSPVLSEHGIPTSVAFTSTEPAHVVASFRSGDTVLYDLEAGSALLTLESRGSSGEGPWPGRPVTLGVECL